MHSGIQADIIWLIPVFLIIKSIGISSLGILQIHDIFKKCSWSNNIDEKGSSLKNLYVNVLHLDATYNLL